MMHELPDEIPDHTVLLALEPEELGAKLLFLMRSRKAGAGRYLGGFVPSDISEELYKRPDYERPGYPDEKSHDVLMALLESWSWLEAQGLIVPDPMGSRAGWRRLSRRAKKFENEAEFLDYAIARRLPKEALHPSISGAVWMSFMRGEFDIAVLQAMKEVEIAVRSATGGTEFALGKDLMRKAFDVDKGELTDADADKGERQGLSDLFAGAISTFKNPQSHRRVGLNNPQHAAEIVMLASLLLRIVDERKKR